MFHRFSEDQGLPTQTIFDLYSDSKGYIWLGTEVGIFRYDGYTFKSYQNDDLLGRSISNISEDQYGRIWCTNFNHQVLFIENDHLNVFQPWENILEDEKQFRVYAGTQDHFLLIFSGKKLMKYDLKAKKWIDYHNMDKTSYSIDLIHDKDGNLSVLWKISQDIYIGNIDSVTHFSNPKFESLNYYGNSNGLLPHEDGYFIYNLRETKTPFILKVSKDSVYSVKLDQGLGLGLNKIVSERDGYIWFLGEKGLQQAEIDQNENFNLKAHFFKNKNITDLVIDQEGNYWFSTLKEGLFLIPRLDFIKFDSNDYPGKVVSLGKRNNNELVIGTLNNQIVKINKNGEILSSIKLKKLVGGVEHFFYDDQTDQLIASAMRGFTIYKDKPLANEVFGNIKDIKNYGKDTLIFANGFEKWLVAWNGKNYKPIEERVNIKGISTKEFRHLNNSRVSSIAVINQPEGKQVWTGFGKGLAVSDQDTTQYIYFQNKHILAMELAVDSNNDLWVGSNKKGVFHIRDKKIVKQYSTSNSNIPGDQINRIISHKNWLWIATNKGFARFQPSTNKWEYLDKNSGLISSNVVDFAVTDQFVFLMTADHLQRIPLNFEEKNQFPPPIYIDQINVNDQKIERLQETHFSYEENNFQFFFTGINFKSNGGFTYQYLLQGLDSQWKTLPSRENTVRFSALPAGNYTFFVKVINADGVESLTPASFSFQIEKPFWETWWYYTLIVVGIIAIVSVLFWFRIRALNRRNQLMLAKNSAEQKLLRSQLNPHFIFNSMSSIQRLILKKEPAEAGLHLGNFGKLMRQILEHSRMEYISIEEEKRMLERYIEIQKIGIDQPLEYQIIIDEALDPATDGIPPLFAQPFVENSLEHGLFKKGQNHENILIIRFEKLSNSKVKLSIQDNGVGTKESPNKTHKSLATKITTERLASFQSTDRHFSELKVQNIQEDQNGTSGLYVEMILPTKRLL